MKMNEKSMPIVYVVSYYEYDKPVVTVFNNKESAQAFYEYTRGVFETWYAHNDGPNPDNYKICMDKYFVHSNFLT